MNIRNSNFSVCKLYWHTATVVYLRVGEAGAKEHHHLPKHRHYDGAEALRPTPHPGPRELFRGKNAPFLIWKERGPDGCYTW